jgi:hypothetical protein
MNMKKLMIAAAAAFCGTVFGLESANTVGYTSVTAKKDAWLLTAVQFEGVDGNDVLLSNLVSGNYAAVDWDENDAEMLFLDTAPTIMIPKAEGGYSNFYYINYEGETFWFDFDAGGPDEGTPVVAGTGIWFRQSGEDCPVTFAGQVVMDSSVPVDMTKNLWTLVSNPYPMAFGVSEVNYNGLVGIDWDDNDAEMLFLDAAPTIMVPKAEGGYSNFYYINYEGDSFWFDFDAGGPDEGAVVPVGSGFWFRAATDVTITFAK